MFKKTFLLPGGHFLLTFVLPVSVPLLSDKICNKPE